MNTENWKKELCRAAIKSRENSYCPYSHFAVGAALKCINGKIYTGCNIESAAFSPSVCAERTAFYKAVSSGEKEFCAIAIAGGKEGENPKDFCPPCGVCRQVMAEFCDENFLIILAKSEDEFKEYNLSQLFPHGFGANDL